MMKKDQVKLHNAIMHSNINNPFFHTLDLDEFVTTDHHFIAPYKIKSIPKYYMRFSVLIRNRNFKSLNGHFLFELYDSMYGQVLVSSQVAIASPLKNPFDICSEWLPIEKISSRSGYLKVYFNGELLIDYEYLPL